jgi:aryl-alcohol dehydrogenase-like predicted oxidoreductase
MAHTLGLTIVPWGALGGGKFKTESQIAELKKRNEQGRLQFQPPSDADTRITAVLEKLANARGPEIGVTGIALAYVMHKAPDVFLLVGGRKIEHLKENIAALNVRLRAEEIKEIEDAGETFNAGFPYNLLGGGESGAFEMKDVALLRSAGYHDFHDIKKVFLIQRLTNDSPFFRH